CASRWMAVAKPCTHPTCRTVTCASISMLLEEHRCRRISPPTTCGFPGRSQRCDGSAPTGGAECTKASSRSSLDVPRCRKRRLAWCSPRTQRQGSFPGRDASPPASSLVVRSNQSDPPCRGLVGVSRHCHLHE